MEMEVTSGRRSGSGVFMNVRVSRASAAKRRSGAWSRAAGQPITVQSAKSGKVTICVTGRLTVCGTSIFVIHSGIRKLLSQYGPHFHVAIQHFQKADKAVQQRFGVEIVLDGGDHFEREILVTTPVFVHQVLHTPVSKFEDSRRNFTHHVWVVIRLRETDKPHQG